jgi:hypothetical protein
MRREGCRKTFGARERPYIAEVRERFATRVALIPWKPVEPIGPGRLLELAQGAKPCPALALAGDRETRG